jgi:hypothetical protein
MRPTISKYTQLCHNLIFSNIRLFSRLFEYLDMMFLLNSRKDDVDKEVAESNIRFGERRASLKLDSHTAVAGECKRQFPCV